MTKRREVPDLKTWASTTGLACILVFVVGIGLQGQIDGDIMQWRGFDLMGLLGALAIAIGSLAVYVAIHERR